MLEAVEVTPSRTMILVTDSVLSVRRSDWAMAPCIGVALADRCATSGALVDAEAGTPFSAPRKAATRHVAEVHFLLSSTFSGFSGRSTSPAGGPRMPSQQFEEDQLQLSLAGSRWISSGVLSTHKSSVSEPGPLKTRSKPKPS